jgi:hypothetical protein
MKSSLNKFKQELYTNLQHDMIYGSAVLAFSVGITHLFTYSSLTNAIAAFFCSLSARSAAMWISVDKIHQTLSYDGNQLRTRLIFNNLKSTESKCGIALQGILVLAVADFKIAALAACTHASFNYVTRMNVRNSIKSAGYFPS